MLHFDCLPSESENRPNGPDIPDWCQVALRRSLVSFKVWTGPKRSDRRLARLLATFCQPNSLLQIKASLLGHKFSLLTQSGNFPKSACSAEVSCFDNVSRHAQISKFVVNSVLAGNFAGDRCDHDCVASQAFRPPERLPRRRENGPEIPAFRAFEFVSRDQIC